MTKDHKQGKSEKSFKRPEKHQDEKEKKNKDNLDILKEEIFELFTGQVTRIHNKSVSLKWAGHVSQTN